MTNQTDYINLITKYLTGEAGEDEILLFENWVKANSANRKIFEDYKKTWSDAERVKSAIGINVNDEWAKFKSKLKEKEIPFKENSFEGKSLFYYLTRIAAAIIFGIIAVAGIYFVAGNLNSKQLVSQTEPKEIQLTDGSGNHPECIFKTEVSALFQGKIEKSVLKRRSLF